MELMQWHDSFSVGVNIIDEQHQQLFMLVNELIVAINITKGRGGARQDTSSVFDYTEMHLQDRRGIVQNPPSI